MKIHTEIQKPEKISSYFICEWKPLLIVTLTGIIYNVGMAAGPWFEGQLAQMLCDILQGYKQASSMVHLALTYIAVILLVQSMRYLKRFYVRRFANNVSRNMKHILYRNLIHKNPAELEQAETGSVITKAIADADTCAEGMRKFTTEIFDTGVVMIAYLTMLLSYDWKLALLCCLFPPIAYILAEKLKKTVSRCASAYKESAGHLNHDTLDLVSGTLTYRILGSEAARRSSYETRLDDYEKKAIKAQLLETTLQPLYQTLSMTGVIFILCIGSRNVLGNGWSSWNIAAFTTFLSCFAKLAKKSSKAAKLFNAVQKARVSWERIRPLMTALPADREPVSLSPEELKAEDLSFSYLPGAPILKHISFTASPGQIIGITGPVACGKSTLGKVFLCERPYEGSIRYGSRELSSLKKEELCGLVSYLGHDPSLLSDTIEENIRLGDSGDILPYLKLTALDREVSAMENGIHSLVGNGGIRLSGGQQARLALSRTLFRRTPLLILDDPFSAVDKNTEEQIFRSLRPLLKESAVLLISHRLTLFPQMDKVLWMEDGMLTESTHDELLRSCPAYRNLYTTQTEGDTHEK